MVPNLISPFFSRLVDYINRALTKRKYRMLFYAARALTLVVVLWLAPWLIPFVLLFYLIARKMPYDYIP